MKNFDIRSLKQLLCDFYHLTNIKVCLYDKEETELYYYPKRLSSFCEILRKDALYDNKCKECDRQGFALCRRKQSQYIYICHAGLRECVSPILCDGQILGYIMIGQIKNSQDTDFSRLEERFPAHLRPPLRKAYDDLPIISQETLLSACHVLDACTGYEALKMLLQDHDLSIETQIDQYIHKHLSSFLSVSDLCAEFHLSRHELYSICSKCFHGTPAGYIKKCRLAHACTLLTTTDHPIYDIAARCGIPDYNYFSKVFKSEYGMSPTEYKKRFWLQ